MSKQAGVQSQKLVGNTRRVVSIGTRNGAIMTGSQTNKQKIINCDLELGS